MKVCTQCRVTKPLLEFNINKQCKGGRNTFCKKCVNFRATQRPGGILAANLLRYWPTLSRLEAIKEYEKLIAKQKNLCAICNNIETLIDYKTKQPRRLAVDHDHRTGKIRGLLCHHCNTAIGKFKDNENYLLAAANYLRST